MIDFHINNFTALSVGDILLDLRQQDKWIKQTNKEDRIKIMNTVELKKKNLIAQWTFDTQPILGRLHLWLEDVSIEWIRGDTGDELIDSISFVDSRTERMLIMTSAVTALGTKLFGRFGEGADLDKQGLNQVKKDADAISAYAMSESLWYLSRTLPENHAIMVCLGEGLMAKAGETAEMGANPLLGFGRIYARPGVAKFLEGCVSKLINDKGYTWDDFRHDVALKDVTIWGAAIDTLENTSRFAKGKDTGPMTVLHLFDQPLAITDQYEGYVGTLILPRDIVEKAADESLLVNYFTPRKKVMDAIQMTYPDIKPENVHVWTLTGKSRTKRIGKLWQQWQDCGAHLVDDNFVLPTGFKLFTDSGTYAPTYAVKTWEDENKERHLFLIDGYAASAEAIQAASLSSILDIEVSMAILSSKFVLPFDKDAAIMKLNPNADNFQDQFKKDISEDIDEDTLASYRESIIMAQKAGIPLKRKILSVDDLIAEKKRRTIATTGYMLPDPYSGNPGIKQISEDTYSVTVRISTEAGDKKVTFTLRLLEGYEKSKLVFTPLLNRFLKGEDYKNRGVDISDSGRIRNELQTLCMDALEYYGNKMTLVFNKISKAVISEEDQKELKDILIWYKTNHPVWFEWLELK
jgi:hypothetical protein